MRRKTPQLIASFAIILAAILYLTHHSIENSNSNTVEEERNNNMLAHLSFDSSIYTSDQSLNFSVHLSNNSTSDRTVWFRFSMMSPMGEWIDFPMYELESAANETRRLSFSPELSDLNIMQITSGYYKAVAALWDSYPLEETSKRIDSIEIKDAFRLYNTVERFSQIDKKSWFSRNGTLGRTQLRNENVFIIDGHLTIKVPAGTLEGGELQTVRLVHYGSYEISMKLPDVPSSITGFFLYKAPDFYHEIDIEVFNQPDSEVLFTTYSDGLTQNEDRQPLPFDPTADFHHYRIDYFPDRTAFYIDDQLMREWTDGFTHDPMQLMVNTWFPSWLDGTVPKEDQSLKIEWIRY